MRLSPLHRGKNAGIEDAVKPEERDEAVELYMRARLLSLLDRHSEEKN